MTSPDDLLRQMFTSRQARDRAALERVTGHAEARAMLAEAIARTPDPTEAELTAEAKTMLAEAMASADQEGTPS